MRPDLHTLVYGWEKSEASRFLSSSAVNESKVSKRDVLQIDSLA